MITIRAKRIYLCAVFVLAIFVVSSVTAKTAYANWQEIVKLYLKEYSSPSRDGTLTIYYNTASGQSAAVMNVDRICTSNIRLAGGVAAGFISELGTTEEGIISALSAVGIRGSNSWADSELMRTLSDYVFFLWSNMGPRNYSFGFAAQYGRSLGDGSWGDNYHCGGAVIDEEGLFAALFQSPLPYSLPGGNWIGDFLVSGEATGSEEWYGIYLSP